MQSGVDFSGSVYLASSTVRAVAQRLNWRAKVLISGYEQDFRGKRVLDLASHDGRFMHAALAHGAAKVVGVEVRESHLDAARANLAQGGHARERYEVVAGDLVEYLRSVEPGGFDTILCFGVLSHLIEHIDVMREIGRIAPGAFILDTWVARERWNLRERLRNRRVNAFVRNMQQGGFGKRSLLTRMQGWFDDVLPSERSRTGNLVLLYEDAAAPGATARQSGLMGWANRSAVEMLFDHYGLDHERVDWHAQGLTDWSELEDYRSGSRESWVARARRA
ncbi:class I SAM-dependent methyltransferase, partial [Burkholderia gladioli]|nr:methyltransferase domain protein [Burkholderia gladioli]TWC60499.1 methyltransferase family protein [Burkholderia sp. SJZ089]TWC96970.1 methyltransferase family protein [Burkholderia sp. SJZ091]TWC97173.1 methyltransferase family protein [Burkholderia sp. SJZ115]KAF1065037.1 Ribosomal RNA large subunit methyltransferase K [Burkholderia gladioli]